MIGLHAQNPHDWFAMGSPEGEKYFEPSRTRTVDGKFISAETLMMDEYCLKCHADIYKSHLHSAHKLSSFNNPAYLFSVRETAQGRRACGRRAGVPAAMTSCRSSAGSSTIPISTMSTTRPPTRASPAPSAIRSRTSAADRATATTRSRSRSTIRSPQSQNAVLQWINNQLVKAKPDLHKKTFLKPFHRTEEFCSTCHKVGVPQEVNHYKEFLRGQNHSDSYLLSGVSGHGVRSFYYPPVAKENCNGCHMPLAESRDFGRTRLRRQRQAQGSRPHLPRRATPASTRSRRKRATSRPWRSIKDFLLKGLDGKSPAVRIDLFGIKHLTGENGVAAPLMDQQPLRPNLPALEPGSTYLVRDGGPHARSGAPLHAGDGRFQRGVGRVHRPRAHRQGRRPYPRQKRRHGRRR